MIQIRLLLIAALLGVLSAQGSALAADETLTTRRGSGDGLGVLERSLRRFPGASESLRWLEADSDDCVCRTAYSIADVSGDGMGDVAVVSYTNGRADSSRTEVQVRSGVDGRELLVEPVVGVGAGFVLGVSLGNHSHGLVLVTQAYEAPYARTTHISAFGLSGALLWTRVYPQTLAASPLGLATLEEFVALGVIETVEGTSLVPTFLGETVSVTDDQYVLRFEVVQASTGAALPGLPLGLAGAPNFIRYEQKPGLLGGAHDVLLRIYEQDDKLYAYPDLAVEPTWTASLKNAWLLETGNVIGDGRAEVLLSSWRSTKVLSPSDGAIIETLPWQTIQVVDDANGDGRDEMVVIREEQTEGAHPWARLQRKPSSGAPIWDKTLLFSPIIDEEERSTSAFPYGRRADINGDGVDELLVAAWTDYYYDESYYLGEVTRVLLDGRSGKEIARGRYLFPLAGDLAPKDPVGVSFRTQDHEVTAVGSSPSGARAMWRTKLHLDSIPALVPCLWRMYSLGVSPRPIILMRVPTHQSPEFFALDVRSGELLWSMHL